MSWLHAFHRLLRRSGLFVASTRYSGIRYLDHPPISAFDGVLLRIFPDLRELNFIQIGANDGVQSDPIATYLNRYHWSGLMLEPLIGNFARLQQLHGNNPRIILRQAALDVVAGRRVVYDLSTAATADQPAWARGLGSFSRERVAAAAAELNLAADVLQSEEVECITWPQVWQEFGQRRCDLLVLDTEGYDITLLRAADLARHRPRLILFEHACVALPERMAFYEELVSLGYNLATFEGDTVASLTATE
ncbi:MAG: FkbM family methyltransferase [Candidatus Didemnitutus sp.]|nr:FkbM family methyltransferase [Candidatus Didemnitutus sp.]